MLDIVGMPRTRTSTLMQLMRGMGFNVLGKFTPWEGNLAGNGEHDLSTVGFDTRGGQERDAVKIILDAFLFRSQIAPEDKVIYCLRPPAGTSWSQGHRGIWKPTDEVRRWNYWRLTAQFKLWMEGAPNPVLVVDTDALVRDPAPQLQRLGTFLGVPDPAACLDLIRPEWTQFPPEDNQSDQAWAVYHQMKGLCSAST
jgi:hypothetical protein